MVIGDLNSNVQWDKRGRFWNHSDVVRELSEIGLRSAYHEQRRIDQGSEPDPTFFLQRNLQKYYHIDYAFVGSGWNLEDVNVGHHLDWLSISDHMPMRLKLSKRSKISESD